MNGDFILGKLLGQREAFNIVAARCTAADAKLLRQIRDQKLYLGLAADWEECCTKLLHTNRDTANRIIKCDEEFGETYFLIAQFARISPATYRLLAPSIRDQALHCNGEAIALIPENAEKVAAAVNELRNAAKAPADPPENPVTRLERRCTELVKELEEAVEWSKHSREIQAVVCYLRQRVERIELTI